LRSRAAASPSRRTSFGGQHFDLSSTPARPPSRRAANCTSVRFADPPTSLTRDIHRLVGAPRVRAVPSVPDRWSVDVFEDRGSSTAAAVAVPVELRRHRTRRNFFYNELATPTPTRAKIFRAGGARLDRVFQPANGYLDCSFAEPAPSDNPSRSPLCDDAAGTKVARGAPLSRRPAVPDDQRAHFYTVTSRPASVGDAVFPSCQPTYWGRSGRRQKPRHLLSVAVVGAAFTAVTGTIGQSATFQSSLEARRRSFRPQTCKQRHAVAG